MVFATEFGTGQVFWSFLWFSLFFMWVWLAVTIFADIFRSADLSGFGKTVWCLFVVVAPFLGVFVYLIARGGKMQEHAMDEVHRQDELMRRYAREAVANQTAQTA